jgi:leucyl-tRNA synthetase
MKKNCGKYSGLDVPRAQEVIKQDLMNSSSAVMFHEMTGKVVCRCLTECIIKMVSDQWFIEYNNEDWKKLAHKCLDKMDLYPDKVRKQFDYVLDWLHRWACTREFGLGTKLPWDNKWVIESLSDSTLQMAYCTISKYLEHSSSYGFSVDKLNDSFFNYIFLGKGNVVDVVRSTGINKVMIETMKSDFNYWYPFDFRNSAKDLIQNHLAFTIFNHTAIFENKYWPRAYVLNGRVMVNNEKMSKSKGNFFTMRELYGKHGADIVRLTSANAGEGLNDANYDMEFLSVATSKLNDFFEFVNSYYDKGRTDMIGIDKWFESKINSTIKESTVCMDTMLFKSAVQSLFLDLHRHLRWYMKRTDGSFNKKTINKYIETQILLLGPFTPHFCEEMWSSIGKKGFLSNASWPKFDSSLIDISLDDGEELIKNTISDIREVLKLAKITSPSNIKLFVSDSWKYDLFREVNSVDSINQKEIIGHVMKDARFKKYGKVIFKFLPKMISSRKVPVVSLSQKEELAVLKESIEFIKKDFDCAISVISASESKENKARNAMPLKPAILVE